MLPQQERVGCESRSLSAGLAKCALPISVRMTQIAGVTQLDTSGGRQMKIEITRVESAFDGLSFGNIGAYEKVVGRALAEVDPRHPLNAGIINIGKASIKAAGRVEYQVGFYLLKPAD